MWVFYFRLYLRSLKKKEKLEKGKETKKKIVKFRLANFL